MINFILPTNVLRVKYRVSQIQNFQQKVIISQSQLELSMFVGSIIDILTAPIEFVLNEEEVCALGEGNHCLKEVIY
jgi:hypothetical protein